MIEKRCARAEGKAEELRGGNQRRRMAASAIGMAIQKVERVE